MVASVQRSSTEEKILEAARRVFTQRGYADTRTRDIAEESGFNLALINYYFRSKEKLFDIIMIDALQTFIESVKKIINDESTTLYYKIEVLVEHYINMLTGHNDLPLFILSEIRRDPKKLAGRLDARPHFADSVLAKQWKQAVKEGNVAAIDPLQVMLNMAGLTIFPFIASPLLKARAGLNQEQFLAAMEQRKKLIPMWMKMMIDPANYNEPIAQKKTVKAKK